jgi:uncharacterized protein (TIGR03118 family)
MKATRMYTRRLPAALVATVLLVIAPAAFGGDFYSQVNLVSDQTDVANHTDANLVNAWGIVMSQTTPAWISNNGSGVSTVYDGLGNAVGTPPLAVQIPAPPSAPSGATGTPTGIVSNPTTGFIVTKGTASGASRFIFATEDGVIAGWSPAVDATHAIIAKDNSGSGAVYKGLAIGANGSSAMLYATDFHNARIDVFDMSFNPGLPPGAFFDPTIPIGFAPFGIQVINGNVYVSYAMQDEEKHDDSPGKGFGYVNVFDPNGVLLGRVISQGKLNSPWGMALAPAGFGKFANSLLVGNFGNGRINAYDLATGNFMGQLKGANRKALKIDGLWGLAFGNGFNNAPVNTLYFTAGPFGELHGLYGRLDVIPGDDRDLVKDDALD